MTSKKPNPNEIKEPKNLRIKVGSKIERFWTQILDEARRELELAEHAALYQKEIIKISETKIQKEQEKFKKA